MNCIRMNCIIQTSKHLPLTHTYNMKGWVHTMGNTHLPIKEKKTPGFSIFSTLSLSNIYAYFKYPNFISHSKKFLA